MEFQNRSTGTTYNINEVIWQSPDNQLLDINFDAKFPLQLIRSRINSLWRYREAIPLISDHNLVTFGEGFTPLVMVDIRGKKIAIKQEQLFSTGSYKDRGATVLLSKAKELGVRYVVQDSSGNAGCAIAAYAAAAGIRCTIYLQHDTAPAKIAQMKAYGAGIEYVTGTRDDVADITLKAARETYYASHCHNPFFFQGTKTFAYEVCEQLGWKAPDTVVLPAGNGTLLIGCYIGFMDLLKAGVITKLPKLIAVQSEQCAPLAKAFNSNLNTYAEIIAQPTIAEGIAIARPVRAKQMLAYVKESKGLFLTVSESEIKAAWKDCAQQGFYIEPTSAATIAGVKKYIEGYPDENIVSLFSGHGLKSTDKIIQMV